MILYFRCEQQKIICTAIYGYILWLLLPTIPPLKSHRKFLWNPDGSWIGKASGSLVESRLRFDAKNFPVKGRYIFQITNATQEEAIGELVDIGLRIE